MCVCVRARVRACNAGESLQFHYQGRLGKRIKTKGISVTTHGVFLGFWTGVKLI